jgi:YVTN family beta-propeller protein
LLGEIERRVRARERFGYIHSGAQRSGGTPRLVDGADARQLVTVGRASEVVMIDTGSNTLTARIPAGGLPWGDSSENGAKRIDRLLPYRATTPTPLMLIPFK